MKNIENTIKEIEELLKEAEQNCEGAAAGYDEGFYSGECNAYSNILNILNDNLGIREQASHQVMKI